MNNSGRLFLTYSFFVILFGIAFGAGFLVNQYLFKKSSPSVISFGSLNNFFSLQTAQVHGVITGVQGNVLTIQNDKKASQDFAVSKKLVISKTRPLPEGGMATPSSDLKQIELNKPVTINLTAQDNKFQIESLFYSQP